LTGAAGVNLRRFRHFRALQGRITAEDMTAQCQIGGLPEVIGVGPPRTATTWLYEVLKGHVGLPRGVKETDFFLRYYDKGTGWYRALFRDCPPGLPAVELCPTYFVSDEARQRIAREIPRCKIIVTLRDPIARLHSHYRLLRREAWLRQVTFDETVARYLKGVERLRMFDVSHYAFHLQQWQAAFGRERVLVAFHDDLEDDPQKFVAGICAFIGIPEIDLATSPLGKERVNRITDAPRSRKVAKAVRTAMFRLRARKLYGAINWWDRTWLWRLVFEGGEQFKEVDPALEVRLRAHFEPEVEELETLTGRDLSRWKEGRLASTASVD
jgi:hypothetical protein